MKVLNFGSLNVDYVYQMDHMVMAGETQSSFGMDIFLGGKGFNQSVALAKAGVSVYHAGLIGDDGMAFIEAAKDYGIYTDFIKKIEGRSGHTIIQVDKNGQNCILLHGGSNRAVTKDFVDKVFEHFEAGDILLLQNEISEMPYIIDKAYEIGMQIFLNPSPYDAYLDACDMAKVSCFFMNEIEGGQISGGETEPDKIIEKVLEKYPDAKIVLTLGSDGSVYADKNGQYRQEIFKVDAVDTTAAGDTFTGYFIAGMLLGMEIPEILRMSALASSITVSRAGATPSIPYMKEVKERFLSM